MHIRDRESSLGSIPTSATSIVSARHSGNWPLLPSRQLMARAGLATAHNVIVHFNPSRPTLSRITRQLGVGFFFRGRGDGALQVHPARAPTKSALNGMAQPRSGRNGLTFGWIRWVCWVGEILSEVPSLDCFQKPIGRRCSDAVLLILGPFARRIMPLFVLQKAAKGSNTP